MKQRRSNTTKPTTTKRTRRATHEPGATNSQLQRTGETTRRGNTPATPPGAKKRTEQHNHKTADQPKHTRTNTDRNRRTTKHTPPTHEQHEATTHPTHHETRTTQTTAQQKPENTTPQGTATAKAIKNTQLPQKKGGNDAQTHGETPGTTAQAVQM